MAWTYYCDTDGQTLSAESKDELAEMILEHLDEEHEMEMTFDDAMQMVNQNAKETAA